MDVSVARTTGRAWAPAALAVLMPAAVPARLAAEAQRLNDIGLKGFGLLVGDPAQGRVPRAGQLLREYDDAGFVADPVDLLRAWRAIEEDGLEPVAMFHVHRRQPANFSSINYRLHNPTFAWHLIISLRDPSHPVVRPILVRKRSPDVGIDVADGLEGSELSFRGEEVTPMRLVLTGDEGEHSRLSAPARLPRRH